ncbi:MULTISPECIES: asparagine synthase (glutamine-hydrolyzing) [Brevibacillus]|jgi:asparagine synthase (glutamine-hydrolysing)|uniref:asparagine synthase (glutamine-hydrolyzing) n=1 Tax=Brevibacillus TaxID=55080 RepID=UPI0004694A59|nr:asparagine synthase (glutamine-hydrolyzing) [Brevibacillus borstelensis]KKX55900.1 asparagine synthase [Brevibacillus borstelensis cifa_chp40]MBE5396721.1 asparagine synthase (glutamine-hydrolyzing) [Brevibacillus borstelensis]MCC0564459.1 asparagine synthase (glutamine-hydrolyzing) [Brevibacillus borstelensis]MCM3471187.1 asparagine synthase (glutamine-hydrolyzing) [Brevibacillus borstelensis]MCM3559661.1 asparagine synthase (glutamine-hydrolyzing) [Brevibacillus borstelensis]
MCGIVSLYNKRQAPVLQETIGAMTRVILHRGPDDDGFHLEDNIALGFRRLSIIDVEGGHQPLFNETRDIWIIGNGEIYNYKELQQWLKECGHVFHTDSDIETILHLYEEVGTDAPKHLRGMFGFTIYDSRNKRLFGARDQFGIKPLYYVETEDSIAVASEIKSLLELPGVKREVNPTGFYHYLTFQYVPDPETMYQGIYRIPPAHFFIIQNDRIQLERYWDVEFKPDESKPFSYFVEGTRSIMLESVDKHRISEVPRGAFLSSGVDSSSIVAMLRTFEDVKTFSVGSDIPGYSELDYARRTAQFLGTEHHELVVNAQRYMDELPRLVWHQDEPVADPSAILLYFVAQMASEHVTVVLSGEGADEFFGGYNIYREPHSLRMFSHMPDWMRSSVRFLAEKLPDQVKGKNFLIRGSKTVEERFFGNALIFSEEMKERVVTQDILHSESYRTPWSVTEEIYKRAQSLDDVTKMQYLDIHTWLRGNILMKADKMTMANSLELRVPFIDTKVFEFAATIPTKYKIANGTTKHVLREAMKDFLPPEIKTRKKLGFPVPTRHWLKNEFYKWAKELIFESKVDHLINKAYVLYMLDEHREGHADYSRKIWTILIFMLWHQIFIEQKHQFGPYVSPSVEIRRKKDSLERIG